MQDQPNVKLCECGCGQPAPIATKTQTRQGSVKGQPQRFIVGHSSRGRVLTLEQRQQHGEKMRGRKMSPKTRRNMSIARGGTGELTVKTIHRRLIEAHPKSGVCDECGKAGRTHYAFKRHPEPHTLDRDDYRELCPQCHIKFDSWLWAKATRPIRPTGADPAKNQGPN